MLHAKAEPSTSAKQKEANQGLLSDSSGPVAPLKHEKNPPPYGAQHRQDALWEGGNEALPPMWAESRVEGDGQQRYYDDALFMISFHRPLPGVRLDDPWELIPGCEWHISPLGRSYFVNHNTRTTSWKKPTPERPAGSLMPECIIKRDSLWYKINLACLGTSGNIMSISGDGSIRQWTRAGKPVGKPFCSDGRVVFQITVSPDGLMVAGRCGDGSVRQWNIKEGRLVGHPWEGNNDGVWCLDWSPNGMEVAGGSYDGTIRRWNPVTGRQIGPPIETGDYWVRTIKYSPQGDKLASGGDDNIRVWSKDGELLIEIKGHDSWVMSLCWSNDGAYIFSGSFDTTIRKWQSIDGEELAVIQGHTGLVTSLCLSPDGSHIISASDDCSVRIWDLKTNQQVGDPLWHDDRVLAVAISSDGQYFASAISGLDAKIYVWSLEAALKRASGVASDTGPNAKPKTRAAPFKDISIVPRQQSNNRGLGRYGNDFWGDDTNHTPRRSADTSSPSGPRNFFDFLRSSTRPTNAIQLQPRRLNFNLFPGRSSIPTVEVAAGRKKNRIYVAPPSAAEVARAEAAAAMQRTNGNEAGSSTQAAQPQVVPGTQASQEQTTETPGAGGGTGDVSYEVNCCAFFFNFKFGRRRPTSHQS